MHPITRNRPGWLTLRRNGVLDDRHGAVQGGGIGAAGWYFNGLLTQEDFDDVSSRVYISALERGVKQPTLLKVDALAFKLGIHPLTLLTLSYLESLDSEGLGKLSQSIQRECLELINAEWPISE